MTIDNDSEGKMDRPTFIKWAKFKKQHTRDAKCLCWLSKKMKNGHYLSSCPLGTHGLGKSYTRWYDHGTLWTTEDGDRVAFGQPYQINSYDLKELAYLEDLGLDVCILGNGWYGHGTVTVMVSSPKDK